MAGALQSTSNPTNISYAYRTHYSKRMLQPLQENLVLAQFAQHEDIPAKMGSKAIRFFKRRPADTDSVASLTEGTAITTIAEMSVGYVDCTLAQIGEIAKISDIRTATDLLNVLEQNIEGLGEDAALYYDTVIRNVLAAGMLDLDSTQERCAGVTCTSDGSVDFTSLAGLTAAQGAITRAEVLGIATALRVAKVPKINGQYVAVVPPQVMHDIRKDEDWMSAATQAKPDKLYNWEVVTLDGIRFIENTNPFRENATYGTYSSTGGIYSVYVLGRGAFGAPKLSGTASPAAPKLIINDKPDKTDPLNQYITVGWKAYYNAVVLKVAGLTDSDATAINDIPYMGVLRCKSTYA